MTADWDLTALLNAADPKATRPERHLWLVRLVQWLRHGRNDLGADDTPWPVRRLKLMLNALERNDAPRQQVVALLARFWHETDLAALFADHGFAARRDLWGQIVERLRLRLLPVTPDTDDLSDLFQLLFTHDSDADWLRAIDDDTLARLASLFAAARAATEVVTAAPTGPEHAASVARTPLAVGPADPTGAAPHGDDWRAPLLQALTWLVSSIRASAFSPLLRRRMSAELLLDRPFEQLTRVAQDVADSLLSQHEQALRQHTALLLALLERCHHAANSVSAHLEEHGVSMHIVFELAQLQARIVRTEAVLGVLLSELPQRELQGLVADLVELSRERRSVRALLSQQYSMLARKVVERHALTGEHYITRTWVEYRAMLRQAAIGGAIVAGTTFAKFALLALALVPFWAGVGAGLNYAISFLIIHLLHGTLATKQPAMTAPAMAAKLHGLRDAAAVEGFVDEVAHLVRSQIAGIVGNLAVVVPLVLAVQALAWGLLGRPLLSTDDAQHVLHAITLLGPTAAFAAFAGVLLFSSSLFAGWAENWFVYHRLESALSYHPAIVARLGAPRAARWARWWRSNISGLAANLSLGLLLGVVPPVLAFIGLPLEVRHVTLSTGQLAAAVGTLGWTVLHMPEFWWCVAGLVVTAALNLGVSFWLALRLALRSRSIQRVERRRLQAAVRQRLRTQPRSFLLPDRG